MPEKNFFQTILLSKKLHPHLDAAFYSAPDGARFCHKLDTKASANFSVNYIIHCVFFRLYKKLYGFEIFRFSV